MKVHLFIFHYLFKKNKNNYMTNLNLTEILLVEDNIDDAELTIRELRKFAMDKNLYHVKDGQEALDFIFGVGSYKNIRDVQYLPKVILLDIQMPKINGIEVLQKIKTDPRLKLIPVVLLTSSSQSPDIQKCYDLGANSYIVKPVNIERFAQAIKNLGTYWMVLNQQPI
jgi:CheY-like chemotaxis protein